LQDGNAWNVLSEEIIIGRFTKMLIVIWDLSEELYELIILYEINDVQVQVFSQRGSFSAGLSLYVCFAVIFTGSIRLSFSVG